MDASTATLAAGPRRYKARYAASMKNEIVKNIRLAPGEEICFEMKVHKRKNWLSMVPGILCLTRERLFLLDHHLFGADWILELPRASLVAVSGDEGERLWLRLTISGAGEASMILLRPFALRRSPSPEEREALAAALRAFLSGDLRHRSPD